MGCVAMIGCGVGNAAGGGVCSSGNSVDKTACPIINQCCSGMGGDSSFGTRSTGDTTTSCKTGNCAFNCINQWSCHVGN